MGIKKYVFMAIVVVVAVYFGALLSSGPMSPLSCAILPSFVSESYQLCPKIIIEGWVDEKYTTTKEAFQLNFEEYLEVGAQLTVYHKGRKVVDLWGAVQDIAPTYSNHSLQRVFSSGKEVEVLAVAICVEKGLFSLHDPIAKYWPEFAKHGKEDITVAQLMRHESGLSTLGASVTLLEIGAYTRGDTAPLARIIEETVPVWPNYTKRVYHSMSRGWVLAELITRVDPQKRLYHQFVREEIVQVLGIDLHYLIPNEKVANISSLIATPIPWFTVNFVLPYHLEGFPLIPRINDDTRTLLKLSVAKHSHLKDSMMFKHGTLDLANPINYNQFYNYSLGSSFGAVGNGAALAAIAAVFEGHGFYASGNVRLFSEETWALGSKCSEKVYDGALHLDTQFSDFGYACFPGGWYGWGGWGGSQSRWNDNGFAMGYAMTRMGLNLIEDSRTERIALSLKQ